MKLGLLLESFQSVITDPIYIASIVFASLGIACALIAKKVTKAVRKIEQVDPKDKLYLMLKVVGLGLILAGFVLLMFGGLLKMQWVLLFNCIKSKQIFNLNFCFFNLFYLFNLHIIKLIWLFFIYNFLQQSQKSDNISMLYFCYRTNEINNNVILKSRCYYSLLSF